LETIGKEIGLMNISGHFIRKGKKNYSVHSFIDNVHQIITSRIKSQVKPETGRIISLRN
jgi:hypothetical protein